MKNQIFIRISTMLLLILLVSGISVYGQDKPDTTDSHHHMMKKQQMHHSEHKNMDMQKNMSEGMSSDSSIVRHGMINLNEIDKNNDGKVYQDPMDWNVISDEPGRCPLCEMKLKEVTLEKAEENLLKHGFKTEDMHEMKNME